MRLHRLRDTTGRLAAFRRADSFACPLLISRRIVRRPGRHDARIVSRRVSSVALRPRLSPGLPFSRPSNLRRARPLRGACVLLPARAAHFRDAGETRGVTSGVTSLRICRAVRLRRHAAGGAAPHIDAATLPPVGLSRGSPHEAHVGSFLTAASGGYRTPRPHPPDVRSSRRFEACCPRCQVQAPVKNGLAV